MEELIHGFDSNVANWHGKFVDSMTVSYGWVFSTERNWGSAYEISKAADARMYQSKELYIILMFTVSVTLRKWKKSDMTIISSDRESV